MQRIIALYNKNKKIYLAILGALAILVLFLNPDPVFAAPAAPVGDTGSITRDINDIFDFLMKMTSAWLWPVIMMIGSLLDNDLIFGGAMGDRLLSVWVEIRNLVNIVFVLILLGIALYNVLGISEEGGLPLAFKTAMPKFVLALIAVNFSFIGIKVLLDFTNVITGAVFALPTTAVEESVPIDLAMKKSICGTKSEETPMRPLFCKGDELNERAQAFFARLDRSNITLAYAVRFGRAVNLKFVNEGIKDIAQLGFNVVFNLVLYIVYGVSFVVLFLVLLFRIVVLWVAVVMSPIMALGIVLPNLKDLGGDTGKIKEQFIKNLIAPIKIGLVLAVGYIMLDGFQADKAIHGSILASSTISSIDPNAIPTDILDLQQLMIAIATVVILWVGVFSAAEGTAASFITNTIKGWGEGAGKWIATTAPTLIPLVPVGPKHGGKQSIAQIQGKFLGFKQGIENKYGINSTLNGDKSGVLSELTNARTSKEYFESLKTGGAAMLATSAGLKTATSLLTKLGDKSGADALSKLQPYQHADIARLIYGNPRTRQAVTDAFGDRATFVNKMGEATPATPAETPAAGTPGKPSAAAPAGNKPPPAQVGPAKTAQQPAAAQPEAGQQAGGGAQGAGAQQGQQAAPQQVAGQAVAGQQQVAPAGVVVQGQQAAQAQPANQQPPAGPQQPAPGQPPAGPPVVPPAAPGHP